MMRVSSREVLPFENQSGDPEPEYFARGFVQDVDWAL